MRPTKPTKRGTRSAPRRRAEPLPIRAVYYVTHLARAMGVTHRRLLTMLEAEGAHVFRDGRFILVPLSEIEAKAPTLWDSMKLAESLRGALDDT